MMSLMLAALLSAASPTAPNAPMVQAAAPQPQAVATGPETEAPVRLEDIEVVGHPLEQMVRDYVREVARPVYGRNLARWDDPICVGVANLQADAAQYIVDRVSTVANDLGLRTREPGCSPNVLIVATDQPSEVAAAMVDRSPRSFRTGASGTNLGRSALNAFRTSTKPVRWWTVSVPVDSETGERAVRMPGECRHPCDKPIHFAPIINVDSVSMMRTQIVDNLNRVVIVVDANQVAEVSAQQLADYIAMVSLAQIDANADTSAYSSILNIFEHPTDAASLTEWDMAYLRGLYESERNRRNVGSNRLEVASSIRRAHTDIRRQREAAED